MTRRGWMLLAAWCGLLALGVAWVQQRLTVSADLRMFLPSPRSEQQRLLVQNIGESPASRLLLIALSGDQPAQLAQISKKLAASLVSHQEFELVANGEQAPLAIPEELLPYRYLITDSFDGAPLDETRLAAELADRAADMASPAAAFIEELLQRDPTLELLHLAGALAAAFRAATHRRRVVLRPTAGAPCWWWKRAPRPSIPMGQTRALEALRAEFERARGESTATLMVSGSGYFSSIIKNRTAERSRLVRHGRHRRPDPADVDRVPASRFYLVRRAATGVRCTRGPGRGQRAVCQRAWHHAGFRFHADRCCTGLSAAPVQPLAPGNFSAGHRAAGVAASRHRRGQHLRRLPGFPHVGRHRPGATRLPDGDRPPGRRPDYPLPAAAHRAGDHARSGRICAAGATQCAHPAAAQALSTAGRSPGGGDRRVPAASRRLLAERPFKAHAGAARAAARRRGVAPRDGDPRPALSPRGERRERGRGAGDAGETGTGA